MKQQLIKLSKIIFPEEDTPEKEVERIALAFRPHSVGDRILILQRLQADLLQDAEDEFLKASANLSVIKKSMCNGKTF